MTSCLGVCRNRGTASVLNARHNYGEKTCNDFYTTRVISNMVSYKYYNDKALYHTDYCKDIETTILPDDKLNLKKLLPKADKKAFTIKNN